MPKQSVLSRTLELLREQHGDDVPSQELQAALLSAIVVALEQIRDEIKALRLG
jgi:hypothetical protein